MIPGDKRSPFVTSGIRLGTPAITTRGMKDEQMKEIGKWMLKALSSPGNESVLNEIRDQVIKLCESFPIYTKT